MSLWRKKKRKEEEEEGALNQSKDSVEADAQADNTATTVGGCGAVMLMLNGGAG
jgi:hypothetical protein